MIRPVILESAVRGRRLDPSQSRPRSLELVGDDHRPVLEWILHALRQAEIGEPLYVGGYHIEKIIESFPGLNVRYHQQRDQEGELGALCRCEPANEALLIISAATVLLPGVFEKLNGHRSARGIYGNGQAAGVYYLPAREVAPALTIARALLRDDRQAPVDALFARLDSVAQIDLDGLAAPTFDQEALARTIFGGKARTLDNLAPLVRKAAFLPRERFSLAEWQADPGQVLDRIVNAYSSQTVVVRSSASGEDGFHVSSAGKYRTVLDVPGGNRAKLQDAIGAVVASYLVGDREPNSGDEVLVQPQLTDLRASGVLLTRDPRSGAPYFVINEDRSSGRSDIVTSGAEGIINQQFVSWSASGSGSLSADVDEVVQIGRELMEVSRLDALDIEYAIGKDGVCHLLQVRPLPAARRKGELADDDLLDLVSGAHDFVRERMRPAAGLLGGSTVLGVMPDWNPAEMIGLSPRPLALSLYQMLIGSNAWAEARRRIGYRDVRPEPLIVSLGGRPYVDVRASLNSFLPAGLNDDIGGKWVDACLERLRNNPTCHDKIEFEIALTCLAPDWEIASRRLTEAGVSANAFRECLLPLTANIVTGAVEPIGHQLAALDLLARRRDEHMRTSAVGIHGSVGKIAHYLQDCERLGLIPFSILARYAFISMTFLRGFLQCGAISEAQYHAFLQAVPTVAGTIADDLTKDLPVDALVKRYGHLRPNSYEITSPNYASDPDRFLRAPDDRKQSCRSERPQDVLRPCAHVIESSVSALGFNVSFEALIAFMVDAIAGRERAKFEFMKSLDAALEGIAGLEKFLELDREKLSFLPVEDILQFSKNSFAHADKAQLRRSAAFNEKRWALTRTIRLPDLIRTADDVLSFRSETWRANFVTREKITAPAVWLDGVDPRSDLAGAIVVTRAADPGYDWIFAHGIAGLITEYGGVASHMSIRAAEFGLPAAIGCGAAVIEALRDATMIELDCASERIEAVA